MKRASCCRSVLLFVCLAAVALGVGAQSALDPRDPASYFAAMPVQNDAERVHELLAEMHSVCKVADDACEPGARLLEVLFQGSYRDELPDFIVELYRDPATGHLDVRQPQLIFDRKSTPLLSGAEHLYVLVFSPVRVAMRARLTTIRAAEVNPLSGFFGVFGVPARGAEPAAETIDTGAEIAWRRLSDDGGFFGLARVPIESEVIARLTLLPQVAESDPAAGNEMDDDGAEEFAALEELSFHVITAHISNSRDGHAAFGVALGATFDSEDTRLAESGGDPAFNAYVLAKFYLPKRTPRLQVSPSRRSLYRHSLGVVLGTNVTNDAFEEIVVGLSWGHLVGKSGLLVAGNWVQRSNESGRELRLLVGIDFSF